MTEVRGNEGNGKAKVLCCFASKLGLQTQCQSLVFQPEQAETKVKPVTMKNFMHKDCALMFILKVIH